MGLKEVCIRGFKTFAFETKLFLVRGIVAVVGPNGCGKTNLADAIRWALGVLSAKALRADEMLDVIFKAAPGVAAAERAEVTLTFNNTDRGLPVDSDEVSISRRLSRQGRSECFINGTSCTLHEIRTLFANTGLGRGGYAIVEQGRIDALVNADPQTRRLAFDDAAGIAGFKVRKREALTQLESARCDQAVLRARIREASREIDAMEEKAERAAHYQRLRDELRERKVSLAYYEYRQAGGVLGDIRRRLASVEADRASLAAEAGGIRRDTARVEEERRGRESHFDELQRRLHDLEREAQDLDQAVSAVRFRAVPVEPPAGDPASSGGLLGMLALTRTALAQAEAACAAAKEVLVRFEAEVTGIESRCLEREQLLRQCEEERRALAFLREREQALRKDEEGGLERERTLERELHNLRLREQEHALRLEHMAQTSLSECGVNLSEDHAAYAVPEGFDAATIRSEIARLSEALSALGDVNPAAAAEMEEKKAKLHSLTVQEQDLAKARSQLEALIRKLDTRCREQFSQTFETIRAHFNATFRKLFGGGSANLVLEDGVDVLEAGVEVVAKPPHKDFATLRSLSGGEKSLTALALVVALFKARRAPLCLLDEADAPLDEANAAKFAALLRELASDTPVIVITHNKATMTATDVLYGVSMNPPGVSRIVSVMLERPPVVSA